MKKIWCYSFSFDNPFETECEETLKSYKFIHRPACFNTLIPKSMINNTNNDFAFAETKEKLLEIVSKKFDDDILILQEKIKKIKEKKELLYNRRML